MNRLARLEVYLRCLDKEPQGVSHKAYPMHVPGSSGEYVGDVFAKSEKWLGTPPTPDCSKWNSREAEILGWQAYIGMQASLEFGSEIEHACRWPGPLHWNQLAVLQRARSRRLLAILRSAFGNHPRTLTLINAFSEGINLCNADVGVNAELQASNGFELVRQLTLEYSIRTRSEPLSFRTALAGKLLHCMETKRVQVTDLVRAHPDLDTLDMQYNHYIHDLDIPENPGFDCSFVGPSNHHASVHMTQKCSMQEVASVQFQLSFQLDQLSPEPLVSLLSQFLLLLACCLASQYLWANYLQHLCFFLRLAHLLLPFCSLLATLLVLHAVSSFLAHFLGH